MNLSEISKLTEDQARATLERIRWPNGVVCTHCGATGNITKLNGKKHRVGVHKCNDCGQQFTATCNSIMEASHLPIRTWLMAFAIMCSSKKGVSALQLQRQLGLGSYRSAWHMAHRIRHAMSQEPLAGLLKGKVEVDETYIGGKPRRGSGKRTPKPIVMALVERGGRVRTKQILAPTSKVLKDTIRANVDRGSMIITDEWRGYYGIGKEFFQGHPTVNHSKGQYARGDGAHTNTVESFFGLLKRGIVGSFHHISQQHLDLYCDEFAFRWSHSKISDAERTCIALRQSEGKRLTYKRPTNSQN